MFNLNTTNIVLMKLKINTFNLNAPGKNLPAAAKCSLVLIGWNPTNGICIESKRPNIKNDV